MRIYSEKSKKTNENPKTSFFFYYSVQILLPDFGFYQKNSNMIIIKKGSCRDATTAFLSYSK